LPFRARAKRNKNKKGRDLWAEGKVKSKGVVRARGSLEASALRAKGHRKARARIKIIKKGAPKSW